MIDDFMQPSRMFADYLTEKSEGSSFLQLVCLLQTLLKLVENVDIVWRLDFHKNLENSVGVCLDIVIYHAIYYPTFLRCKTKEKEF